MCETRHFNNSIVLQNSPHLWNDIKQPDLLNSEGICVSLKQGGGEENVNTNKIYKDEHEGTLKETSVVSSSSSESFKLEEKQKSFTAEFLRCRDVSALRCIVAEVRSMMERCCLPSIDVDMIEKYIIANIERGQERKKKKTTTAKKEEEKEEGKKSHVIDSSPQTCVDVIYKSSSERGDIFVDCAEGLFSGVTSPSSHLVRPLNGGDFNGVVNMSTQSSSMRTIFGTHSRHAALYALAYKPSFGEKRGKDGKIDKQKKNIQGPRHIVNIPTKYSSFLRGHKFLRGHITEGEDNNTNEVSSLLYDNSVADLMQLRFLLRIHESRTLIVLDAIDRREAILSKLYRFLKFAAEDICGIKSHNSQNVNNSDSAASLRYAHTRFMRSRKEICRQEGQYPRFSVRPPSSLSSSSPSPSPSPSSYHSTFVRSRKLMTLLPSRMDDVVTRRRYYRRGILYFLQRLQRASVDVVCAVQTWRKLLTDNYPFVVEGRHYLLYMLEEMADLSKEPVLHVLFSSNHNAKRYGTKQISEKNGSTIVDMDTSTFPESLQFYPLLSNIPNLMDYRKPPKLLTYMDGVCHFDMDEHNKDNEDNNNEEEEDTAWGIFTTQTKQPSRVSRHGRRFVGNISKDVLYFRQICDAEAVLNSEIAVQLKLLRRNFAACAEGWCPLLLRGVSQMCGSNRKMVRLKSRQRQRELYWNLHDMLSSLEEGTSMVCKD